MAQFDPISSSNSNNLILSINDNNASSFQWQVSSDNSTWNNIIDPGSYGSQTSNLEIDNLPVELNGQFYRCEIIDDSNCGTVYSSSIYISMPEITAQPQDVDVCTAVGGVAGFSVNSDGAVSYQWQFKSPGDDFWNNVTSESGYNDVTLNIADVTNYPNQTQFRCLINDFLYSDIATLYVSSTYNNLTDGPVLDNNSFCSGWGDVYVNTSSSSYQWQYSPNGINGWQDVNDVENGSNSSWYYFGLSDNNFINNMYYRCEMSNACGTSTSDSVLIQVPAITGQPQSLTVCDGSPAGFIVMAVGSSIFYHWQSNETIGQDWLNNNPLTGNSQTLQIDNTNGMNGISFYCYVTIGYGSSYYCSQNSNIATLTTTSPDAAGAIEGQSSVCSGQNGLTYNVVPIGNATGYTWIYTGTGATINGTTNSITIDFASGATSGTLTVQGTDYCDNNGFASEPFPITINTSPAKPETISGPTAVCQVQTGVPYSVNTTANATGYTWSLPDGATIASGNGTNNITVDYTNASNGTISVQGTNICGNGDPSQPLSISVAPANTVTLVLSSWYRCPDKLY